MIVIADTSALLSAFGRAEPLHDAAVAVLNAETFVLSPMVLTELHHLAYKRSGFETARAIMGALLGRLADGDDVLGAITLDRLRSAHEVQGKYASLELDLADCIGVVLADEYQTDRIFTLDQRDFRAVRPLTPKFDAFKILPADC
ncbi:type II toxin-antitoxin system VapC family toxin [Glycomyces paridis]|uniref:Ribonuclease VapC n=1 Tax=Glycomyces paridis TaxID=2126555 RepID=A0A4S8PMF9_9ACTN|nr:PIN domain-containing protein [Glycomyces paridis]THV32030.1 PIN domain-containing protein [Glycomyces paridis]